MKYPNGDKMPFPYKALYKGNRYAEGGEYSGIDEGTEDLVYEIRGEFAKELLAAGLFKD